MLSEPELDLALCGLPADYYELGEQERKFARMGVLTSWFDPEQPNVLCTDVEAFLRASRLWVEFYIKPDPWNRAVYFFKDPSHKYDMLRAAMSDPIVPKEPAKAVVHAPRGSTKTVTLVHENIPMIAACRPNTFVLISQATADLTSSKIDVIRDQFQNNERIEHDFGGPGRLYPRSRFHGDKWNSSVLCLVHHNSRIQGISVGSKLRGKHPDYGVIDDPEDDEQARNPEFRKKFIRWLFNSYLNMFGPGGKVLWIGTVIDAFSCLQLALKRLDGNVDLEEEEYDTRFDVWARRRISPTFTDGDGETCSIFPEKWDVDDIATMMKTRGRASVMAELYGTPVSDGATCLVRDSRHHGFVHCIGDGGHEYMLDLLTGEKVNWSTWLDRLDIVAAMDPADSTRADACPGAVVVVGFLGKTIYVLDAWIRRQNSDVLTEKAFTMCALWGAAWLIIESDAMQRIVVRTAQRCRERIIEEGKTAPVVRPIRSQAREKIARISSTLIPVFAHRQIRLPHLEQTITDDAGHQHVPMPHAHARYVQELKNQIDAFSEDGGIGWIDGLDALEMALRFGVKLSGRAEPQAPDRHREAMRRWEEEVGIEFGRHNTPMQLWTPEMWEEAEKPVAVLEEEVEDEFLAMDPYA